MLTIFLIIFNKNIFKIKLHIHTKKNAKKAFGGSKSGYN